MEYQDKKSEHFRHLFLYAINQGCKAANAARDICAGEGVIDKRTVRDWSVKVKNGNFDLIDAPRFGSPVQFD